MIQLPKFGTFNVPNFGTITLDLQEVRVLEVAEESESEHLERISDAMAAAE